MALSEQESERIRTAVLKLLRIGSERAVEIVRWNTLKQMTPGAQEVALAAYRCGELKVEQREASTEFYRLLEELQE